MYIAKIDHNLTHFKPMSWKKKKYIYNKKRVTDTWNTDQPFKDEVQTALFKDPVRTAL
jgi:hypothetical protein